MKEGLTREQFVRLAAMTGALAFEVNRLSVSFENPSEAELLLTMLAEYHCEHNGLHSITSEQIKELVDQTLKERGRAIQDIITDYAFDNDLF